MLYKIVLELETKHEIFLDSYQKIARLFLSRLAYKLDKKRLLNLLEKFSYLSINDPSFIPSIPFLNSIGPSLCIKNYHGSIMVYDSMVREILFIPEDTLLRSPYTYLVNYSSGESSLKINHDGSTYTLQYLGGELVFFIGSSRLGSIVNFIPHDEYFVMEMNGKYATATPSGQLKFLRSSIDSYEKFFICSH